MNGEWREGWMWMGGGDGGWMGGVSGWGWGVDGGWMGGEVSFMWIGG